MSVIIDYIIRFKEAFPLLEVLVIALIAIILFNFALVIVRGNLLKKATNKHQISNIKIFSRILNIVFTILVFLFGFLSYIKSWAGIGVALGLFTAALGFALQRPITGLAAWLMVVFKRPFQVGDRISIGDIKGDVYDITLSHLYIDEVGGIVDTEQHFGRNVLVPNYKLFEENIINHTLVDDLVLAEVKFSVTYESNLDKAMDIAFRAAREFAVSVEAKKKEPTIRVSMGDSGVNIRVIFLSHVQKIARVKSDINKKIFDLVNKTKDVEFAYPHMEVMFKKNKRR